MRRQGGIGSMLAALPLAQQVVIGIAVAVLAMAAVLFMRWISEPSYGLLYSNLDDQSLATVVDELDRQDVPYKIEGGGSRVLVPRSQVYELRAALATAGVRSGSTPQGYELLDDQGLNVSDFRQRVDYQRALEGELSRTLLAMNDITSATVHLVLPEERLFAEDEEPTTASVLIATARPLSELEVETITFLVASAVEGLEAEDVTVADVDGTVLAAAGEMGASSAISNRNLRMTRDFEQALATDVRNLLGAVVGPNAASVVVRAQLDFDETTTEAETYDPESAIALREQTVTENFSGSGVPPGGTLGTEGGPVPTTESDDYTYDRSEVVREYGVDRVISRSVDAPGKIEQLSVAVVMDDGSQTGAPVPAIEEVESLITAALGLDPERGDTIAVSTVAFPAPEDGTAVAEPAEAGGGLDPMSLIPQAIGGLVLLLVAVALMLMSRGSKSKGKDVAFDAVVPGALPPGDDAEVEAPALVGAAVGTPAGSLHPEVVDLVQRQPEEIAVLLRGWLADRR